VREEEENRLASFGGKSQVSDRRIARRNREILAKSCLNVGKGAQKVGGGEGPAPSPKKNFLSPHDQGLPPWNGMPLAEEGGGGGSAGQEEGGGTVFRRPDSVFTGHNTSKTANLRERSPH